MREMASGEAGTPINRWRRVLALALLILFAPSGVAATADFPVPDNLLPAINFWTRVYTEVDTGSGFLHDSENLDVVYQRLERDRDAINKAREAIRADLRALAAGKRRGLTASQQLILNLWGADVSNARLQRAAGNIRWQLGQSDRFMAGMKRSGTYRAHIEEAVRSRGLPMELVILPHVESSFHPGAFSSAAATGMWQFTRSTAQRFMRVDHVVDERLDPYTATYGALDLLEFNYNALGTWPLALTAYNHGANGIARAIRDTGATDIGRIVAEYRGPLFGFASRNFYAQFLAALEVDRRADGFFGPIAVDEAPDFIEHKLEAFVDAQVLARSLGLRLEDLKRDNPALLPSVWSGSKRIPKGYSLKIDRRFFRGDLLAGLGAIPVQERHGEQIPDVSYTVRRGDSLSVIAQRFDTSVTELAAINQLRNRNRIRVGQVLKLPQGNAAASAIAGSAGGTQLAAPQNGRYQVRRGDTVSVIAQRFNVPAETIIELNDLNSRGLIFPGQTLLLTQPAAPQPVAQNRQYQVRRGDTVSAIAARHGVSAEALATLNNLNSRRLIVPGQILLLPGAGAPAPDTSQAGAAGGEAPQLAQGEPREYRVRQGDSVSDVSARYGVPVHIILGMNNLSARSLIFPGQILLLPPLGAETTFQISQHEVRRGDTISDISARYGIPAETILALNNLNRQGLIYPGQVLRLRPREGGEAGAGASR